MRRLNVGYEQVKYVNLNEEQINKILAEELEQFNRIADKYRNLLLAIGEL